MSKLYVKCVLETHGFYKDHDEPIFIAYGPVSWPNIQRKAKAFSWLYVKLFDDSGMLCPKCQERLTHE